MASTSASHDSSEPQKEALSFDVDTEGLPVEITRLLEHIKEVAEVCLFHWRTFPIHLPPPVAVNCEPAAITSGTGTSGSTASGYRPRPLALRDVFVTPCFDELDAVAVDKTGDPRGLSANHLQSIREKGEFEVESLHFPAQTHRWRVSSWLQKGTARAHDTLLQDTARALSLLAVTARNRISSPFFSVTQSVKSFWQGIVFLMDVCIGVPWVEAHNLEERIKEERCSYLVQELTCKDGDLDNLCVWIIQQVRRATREKYHLSDEKQPAVPYTFFTPQGLVIDLRLFNRELMKKALPVLVGILEKEARGWFLHFREKTVAELKANGLSDVEVEKEANRLVQDEYLSRVFSVVRCHPLLLALGDCVPELLIQHAQAVLLMHKSIEEVDHLYEEGEKEARLAFLQEHSILSRIPAWLREHLSAVHDTLVEQHRWHSHEQALTLCRQRGLEQHAYFLQRDLQFMREREPVLLKELECLKVARREYQWRSQIWFPVNYVVRRSFQGDTETVPTVLAVSPTSITTPRTDPNHPVFLLEKQVIRLTSTRWLFWRWINIGYRTWTWTSNALFFFGIWLPICSPVSLRALLYSEPFMSDFELSQVNGTVCPSKGSLTPTLGSRLHTLWRHISKSRSHFETTPDTGFIGKGVSRHANRVWNYFLKGIVGTLFLTLVFPILCLAVSMGSLLIAILAPLWVPVVVLATQVTCILVYDIDSPVPNRRWCPLIVALFWHLLVLGILQPAISLLVAWIVCPVSAALALMVAVLRRGSRHVWDLMIFHCVIKNRARIPASDSFLAKRIAGPGLNGNYYFQVNCEQALAAFEARLELDELMAYQLETEKLIKQPLTEYIIFVERCFGPFSGMVNRSLNFERVEREAKDLTQTLIEKMERRKRDLSLGLPAGVKAKIKMSTRDLKMALKQATLLIEEFYPNHVLNRVVKKREEEPGSLVLGTGLGSLVERLEKLQANGTAALGGRRILVTLPNTEGRYESVENWWEVKGLEIGDYSSLAALIFTEIFSPNFLTPMEDFDTSFRMESHGVSLSRYTEMIHEMPHRPDLEEKLTVHAPRGNIQVHAPYLDITSFTPLVRHSVPTHKAEKTSLAQRISLRLNPGRRMVVHSRVPEKLMIPPPVPHPAHIAVIIYNREASEAIRLDAPLTMQVIRTVEDSPHVIANFRRSIDEDGTGGSGTPLSDTPGSTFSGQVSLYDDPTLYAGHFPVSRSGTAERAGVFRGVYGGSGRSGVATLEKGNEYSKSSTLELTPNRGASRRLAPSPLRSLLESQRPFTVALNLASAEDTSLDLEDEWGLEDGQVRDSKRDEGSVGDNRFASSVTTAV